MIKDYLPKQVDAFRFAENATTLHGLLPLIDMPRLAPSLQSQEGEVKVQLSFGIDKQKTRFIQGSIEAVLALQCQRCMQPLNYEIMSKFSHGLVRTEEKIALLSSKYEPLLIHGDMVDILDIVEEELIVNLPIVTMHKPQDCQVKLPIVVKDPQAPLIEKENPFKVIELLKARSEKSD